MRKFAIGKSVPAEAEGEGSKPASTGKEIWIREHWRLVSLFAIILFAFAIRFVFAYGISAGSDYSLSGGSGASNHLRIITEILAGTYDPSNQSSLNYPYGTESIYGPFFDYVMAGIAYIVTLFGVSDATAAAGTLAWSAPILGALTCIPVFLATRRMFKDEVMGVAAALFYAVFAITIMTTPFSNGTEFPMVCFLAAWLLYAVVRTIGDADRLGAKGLKAVVKEKTLLKDSVLTGLLFAAVCLSWPDFRVFVVVSACIIAFTLVIDRIGGRDMGASVGIMDLVLAVGIGISAAYYIPMGLWDAVFSGGCVLAALTIVFATAFVVVGKKPWVVTIPAFIIAIVAAGVVLTLVLPDLADAVFHGNEYYDNDLMKSLGETFTRSSISSMASWFGWVTVWFPLALGAWMFYRFRKHGASRMYTFTMLWLLSMFFIGWFASGYAIIAAPAFAAGTAAVLVRVIRAVDMKAYLRSLRTVRGAGGKVAAKRIFDFFPFVTLVSAVCLVAAPAAVYGYDAATPTNDEGYGYNGGLGYTINTTDSNLVTSAWNGYTFDDGALLCWYGYSDSASSLAGVKTVTSSNGGGTYAMANAMMGSSTDAVASMMARLMISSPDKINAASFPGISADDSQKLVDVAKGGESVEAYDRVSEVFAYYSFETVCDVYEKVCADTGSKIGYIEVDASMLPIYSGDGSPFSTLAYFDGCKVDEGAVKEYFSYNYGYITYTDAMYSTFVYAALLGMTPSDAGQGNIMKYLGALSANDGTVKAAPGNGLQGFKLDYWHVMYNSDSKATSGSDGWIEVEASEAIGKQKAEGGVINYLSSVMIYKYVGMGGTVVSGEVKANSEAAPGIAVYVRAPASYDSSKYVICGIGYTDKDGKYSVPVPAEGDYHIEYAAGQTDVPGSGVVDKVIRKADIADASSVDLGVTKISGTVTVGDVKYAGFNGRIVLKSNLDARYGMQDREIAVTDGTFSAAEVQPGTYTASVYATDGTHLKTVTLSVPVGEAQHLSVSVDTKTITVTVKDQFGALVADGIIVKAVDTATGLELSRPTADGVAKIPALVGSSYTISVDDGGYVSNETSTVGIKSVNPSDQSKSITVFKAVTLTVNGVSGGMTVSAMSSSFQTSVVATGTSVDIKVPALGNATYAIYSVFDGKVYAGTAKVTDHNGATVTLSGETSVDINGTVTYGGKGVASTAVFIKDGLQMIFSTDADGKIACNVPAGDYTVFAYDGNGHVAYGKAVAGIIDLTLEDEAASSTYVRYSFTNGSSKAVPFTDVKGTFTIGATEYSIVSMTGPDGKAVFHVPKGVSVVSKTDAVTEGFFKDTGEKTGNSITFTPVKIPQPSGLDSAELYDKEKDGTEITGDVSPGSYYLRASSNTGGHYEGYVEIYPDTQTYNVTPYKYKVSFTVPENAKIEITAVEEDGETGSYQKVKDTDSWYLNEGGYFFTITDNDGKIAYCSVNVTGFGSEDFGTPELSEAVTLSGDIGYPGDGKMSVEFGGNTIVTDIKKGAYSVKLPKGSGPSLRISDMGVKGDNAVYNMNWSGSALPALTEDTVYNFSVTSSVVAFSDNKDIEIIGHALTGGSGTLKIRLTNGSDHDVTYILTGTPYFVLDKTYIVNVSAGGSAEQDIVVSYYSTSVGAGTSDMAVNVAVMGGDKFGTAYIPAEYFDGSAAGKLTVETAADGESVDSANNYSYSYAFTFKNKGADSGEVTFAPIDAGDNWKAFVVSDGGKFIQDGSSATTVHIDGFSTEAVYVMLVNTNGAEGGVPSLAYGISGEVSKSGTIEARSGSVSVDGASVSGGGIDNEKETLSSTFWALTVLTVLLLFVFFWAASKRGVFSRKN